MAPWKQEASFQLLFSSELYLYLRTVDINILTQLVFAKLVSISQWLLQQKYAKPCLQNELIDNNNFVITLTLVTLRVTSI